MYIYMIYTRLFNMTTTKAKNARKMRKREKIGNGSSLVSFQTMLKENKSLTPNFEPGRTVLTREEVSKHNTPSDCWTIYKNAVYNLSPFLDYHPGGEEELMKGAGKDCTLLYDKVHPWVNADAVLGPLRLGSLKSDTLGTPKNTGSPKSSKMSPKSALRSPPRPSMAPPSPPRTNQGMRKGSSRAPMSKTDLSIITSIPTSPKIQVRTRDLMNGTIGLFKIYLSVRNKYVA